MNAALATLLFVSAAPPALPAASSPALFRAVGKGELSANSQWHKLDLKLTTDGDVLDAVDLSGLLDQAKAGNDRWRILPAKLTPLMRAIHGVKWSADDADKYGRWQGTGATTDRFTVRGIVNATATRDANGTKITITGKPIVTDEGTTTDRVGPNAWLETWTHTLTATATLDAAGSLVSFELTDDFEVKGQFHTGDKAATDPNTRKGSIKLTLRERKPLTAADAARVAKLIASLSADEFETRQKASEDLTTLAQESSAVADLIQSLDLNGLDPEVALRVGTIRGKLREK